MIARLAPLRVASRDFIARWRRAERRSATSGRHVEAMVALLLCGLVVATAWLGDAALTTAARALPWQAVYVFGRITGLGESGWIFAVAFIVLCVSLLLRTQSRGLRANAALGLLAGRAFFVIAVNAISGVLSLVVKAVVGRARPRLYDVVGPFHFDLFSWKSAVLSFPSGHAVTAFATALALAFMLPRGGRWFVLVAVLIAASRVVTGAHYMSDVIAGAALGAATSIFARRAFAARRIVFRETASGVVLRGAGLVAPTLRRTFFRRTK